MESSPKDPRDPPRGAVQRFGHTDAYDVELNEELDRAIDLPRSRGGPGYNAHSYIAVDRWTAVGIRFEVYSTGGGGDVFLFETVADCERAEQMIVDLREEFRAWRETIEQKI